MKKLLALLLLLPLLSAVSLETSDNSITISGTEARVFAWISTKGFDSASFHADLGPLNGFFEDSFVDLTKTRGTYLHLTAPDCAEGSYDLLLTARACTNNECIPVSKTIRVYVLARKSCSYKYDLGQAYDYFEGPHQYGHGSTIYSTVQKHSYYDPTDYQVRITGPTSCLQVKADSYAKIKANVYNQGASTSIDLRLVGNEEELNAIPSQNHLSLSKNEVDSVYINVNPSRVRDGRYFLTLQATVGGVVVGDQSFCFDVENDRQANLDVPLTVKGNVCEPIVFYGTIQNTGTGQDSFTIEAPSFVSVNPHRISLGPSEFSQIQFLVNPGELPIGSSTMQIKLIEDFEGKTSAGNIQFQITSCTNKPSTETSVTTSNVSQDLYKYTAVINNDGLSDLQNVRMRLEGVPNSWEQKSDLITIPGQTSQIVSLLLTRNSDEAAEPVLIIEADGRTIETIPVDKIPARGSGITGLFTALGQNSFFIGILIIIAVVIIMVLFGRRKTIEDEYRDRITSLKHAVEDTHETHESHATHDEHGH
ncbi:hypothetical protein HUU53_00680 [Candidatus Micrarchaeota archaeon]|nr:hypothetical protein [Candidatus Micrarchaeota archaeon]